MCNHESHDRVAGRSLERRDLLRSGLAAAALAALPRGRWAAHAEAASASDHIDTAKRAERWIRAHRIESANGVAWPADPRDPKTVSTDLYNGYPGVIVLLLELHAATGERTFLDEAVQGARSLVHEIPASAEAAKNTGLYTGLAGIGFIIGETARASKNAELETATRKAFDIVKAAALPDAHDIISGKAGVGLYLLHGVDRFKDKSAMSAAVSAGEKLLEAGRPAAGGLKWQLAPTVQNLYPNFSHGAAGVGYFLATLYGATREQRFLDGARAAARYLDAVAHKQDGGWRVFHHEPGGENLYYLSWCHGPAGTARLFYRLSQVTGEKSWLELVDRCAQGTLDMGVPEQRSEGFWNNISQCCGNCGVGEFFLDLNEITRKKQHLDVARRVASDTLKRATTEGDGLKWIQAEHRVRPELLIAQTGFMQGAAGVGTFFLHLDARERGRRPAVVFPDDPFTES